MDPAGERRRARGAERRDDVEELEHLGVSPREARGESDCADKPERGLSWQGSLAAPHECDQRQRDKANPEREGDGADAVVKERIRGDAESEPGAGHGEAHWGVEADAGRSDRATRGALVSDRLVDGVSHAEYFIMQS